MLEEQIREFLDGKAGVWLGQGSRDHHSAEETRWAGGHSRHSGGNPFGGNPFGGGAGGGSGGGFPPFPPFAGFPWNLFRRPRAKRGDVRAAILSLLAEKSLNGYQIMQELEQRSRGSWRPSPGAVYPALQQLEDEGLVRAESTTGGRTYVLTDEGHRYVREHADEFAASWETPKQNACDDNVVGLFAELKHIAAATIQVVHTGSNNQIAEALKILHQARRGLYRLLADDVGEESDE